MSRTACTASHSGEVPVEKQAGANLCPCRQPQSCKPVEEKQCGEERPRDGHQAEEAADIEGFQIGGVFQQLRGDKEAAQDEKDRDSMLSGLCPRTRIMAKQGKLDVIEEDKCNRYPAPTVECRNTARRGLEQSIP